MTEPSLGIWLRRERERRGITIRQVADQTKVAAPLLEGLENGDLSRWPGGIYRRAFVKSYAAALGLDTDEVVRRFEQEHPAEPVAPIGAEPPAPAAQTAQTSTVPAPVSPAQPWQARIPGVAADLAVAIVLGLGSAAAGSRLLWPVILIALYYAAGVLFTGTSPMVALLRDAAEPASPPEHPARAVDADTAADSPTAPPRLAERRHQSRRTAARPQRTTRATRPRVQ